MIVKNRDSFEDGEISHFIDILRNSLKNDKESLEILNKGFSLVKTVIKSECNKGN